MTDILRSEILTKSEYKKLAKEEKQIRKEQGKSKDIKKRVFVVKFDGDIKASDVHDLREEINAILMIATPRDEVVAILESPGGMVPHYGLAASQLERIKQQNIPLTVAVDKVAASGGYMMACVADKILAAPFAYIGSIGVAIEFPNFNKLLKKNNIDYEQITAGEFKRTLTMLGENTEKARKKVKQDVEDLHYLFKEFIKQHRPHVDIDAVATGDYWPAKRALELNLVDELITSDDYLLSKRFDTDIFMVNYLVKKNLSEKIVHVAQKTLAQFSGWF
jgi:serine protease SohB